MGIAGHPDEDDVMLAMLSDGTIQAFAMEQTSMKKLYVVGGISHSKNNESALLKICQMQRRRSRIMDIWVSSKSCRILWSQEQL